MEWHYADGQTKYGPLPEAEIKSLIATGRIQPTTLVWNSALTEWKAARETALFPDAPTEAATQQCLVTGKTFPVSQMIKTQHGWVSIEGKERYYQSLRENAPIPTAVGVTNAKRSGKKFVIPVSGGQLPRRCVKTGAPVSEAETKSKTLYWCSPWAAIAILLNLIVYIIIYYAIRKKVIVAIPLSAEGRAMIRKHTFIGVGMLLGGLALAIFGFASAGTQPWLPVIGILLFLVGLIYALVKSPALRIAKIKNGEAWFTGACPEFLAALSEY